MRHRACAIVLSGTSFMFMRQMVNGKSCRVFVGGGVEEGETAEQAVMRELDEEACVSGKIIYGPVTIQTERHIEHIFVIDVEGCAPSLGYDPELPENAQDLKGIVWAEAAGGREVFNAYDMKHVSAVTADADVKGISGAWLDLLKSAAFRG